MSSHHRSRRHQITEIIGTIGALVFVVLFISGFLYGIFGGLFIGPSDSVAFLQKMGFSNIHQTGKSWFMVGINGCDRDDVVKYTFTTTNPAGKVVTVHVCDKLTGGPSLHG